MAAFAAEASTHYPTIGGTRDIATSIMEESALMVRDVVLELGPNSGNNRLMCLGSISKAVWLQDVKLANIPIEHSEIGFQFLMVGSSGVHNASVLRIVTWRQRRATSTHPENNLCLLTEWMIGVNLPMTSDVRKGFRTWLPLAVCLPDFKDSAAGSFWSYHLTGYCLCQWTH